MCKEFLPLVLLTMLIQFSQAQISYVPNEKCAMNEVEYNYSLTHPQYAQEVSDFKQVIQYYSTHRSAGRASILTIPVVVHVIHLSTEAVGTGRNLTDARVQAQIQILNRDFLSQNPNWTSGTPAVFQSLRGTPEIQFCLATKDPNGNTTTGIDRQVFANPASTTDIENTIKPQTTWDATKYLNIWTLAIPGTSAFGGTLGYAYLPTFGVVGSDVDGVVIDYRWFGAPSISGVSGDCRALTHETGHYLGLPHTWGETSSSHVCTDDDGISDTPLQQGPTSANTSFSCASGVPPTSCSGVQSMYCDYMDYVNDDACYSTFTTGQVNVMRSVIQGTPISVNGNTYIGRSSLLNSQLTACTSACNLTATTSGNGTTCGQNNGTASVTPAGGTTYSYAWSNGGTSASLTGLAAGTYTVTVTSGTCTVTATRAVATSTGITATATGTATSACGTNDGTSTVTPAGGTTYTYAWSNGGTSASISSLSTGNYTVTVTSNGCTATAAFTVSAPNGITASTSGSAATCGQSNGTATATPSGGTAYIYAWSNGGSTATISGLSAGTYTVTVTSNGCSVSASRVVTPSGNISTAATGTAATGCSTNDGTATANPSGGTTYTYTWSNGATSQTITGLQAGTYTVTALSNGCSATASFTVTAPNGITASANGTAATGCGTNDGAAGVLPSGGSNYTYTWSNGGTSQAITGLQAGTYTVTVLSNGCSATASFTVTAPNGITATASGTPATGCGTNDGTATATPAGGSNYTFTWSNGATTAAITGLQDGNYTVTVLSNGCSASATYTVTSPNGITASTSGNNTTCGFTNGTAFVTALGGSAYTYAWSNGETTANINGLVPGTYDVTVTSGLCTATATQTIAGSFGIAVSTAGTATSTCTATDGTASAAGSGGLTYTYAWSNGGTTATISGLGTGNYTVTAFSNGCSASASYTVTAPNGITVTTSGTNTSCGKNNGSATVTANGGSTYTYVWNTGATTPAVTNLSAGTYTVTAVSNGCSATGNYTVAGSSLLTVTATSTATTNLTNNGTATVTATGGVSPYTYTWSNGQTTQTATGLNSGQYIVTVTDQSGCTALQAISVGSTIGIALVENIGKLDIYPNPTENILNLAITCNTAENITVDIANISGQVLLHNSYQNVKEEVMTLNTATLASGFYYVRITTQQGTMVAKVMKQ